MKAFRTLILALIVIGAWPIALVLWIIRWMFKNNI